MQDMNMQPAMQPFIKLVQSNLALITQFAGSPEAVGQAMSNAQSLFQQAQGSASSLAQSQAFAQLMQGMLKNYTEFMAELGQSSMAMLSQGQAAMVEKAQEASESFAGSGARGARTRR
jgi:hypothetical protein